MELNICQSGISKRTLKIFHRKNRTGAVVKTVREHYLRNDIPCGLSKCSICPSSPNSLLDNVENYSLSSLVLKNHIAIVDLNIMLHKTDILDDNCFKNVIITQSVWEAVKQKSPPAYKKMHSYIFCEERGFFVFMNDFHEQTYVPRESGDSADDRIEKSLIVAAKFYKNHLELLSQRCSSKQIPSILVLFDNIESRDKARKEGLDSLTLSEYVKGIGSKPELADKLAAFENREEVDPRTKVPRGQVIFPEHLSADQLQTGLRTGKFKKGAFQVSRDNYLEATVNVETEDTVWFIQGLLNSNRAVHGDIVVLQLLPRSEWSCPARLLKMRDLEESNVESAGADLDTDEMDESEGRDGTGTGRGVPSARVLGILQRNWRPYCGLLLPSPIPGARRHLFAAAERRIPRIRIETSQVDILKGQRIVVSIDSWPIHSRYPNGHYVRTIGILGDRATENEVLLLEHDIPHYKFSQAVLQCLPQTPWFISDEERQKRLDLRDVAICSVDPVGCTDIDDALHCRQLDDGNFEAGVHIADVSHFVRPDTAMDSEASVRGTTVYLCDKRIDMLPDLLSSNLCSLRADQQRLAFSVIWKLSRNAEILHVHMTKSVICSRAALTYEKAQQLIDGTTNTDPVSVSLRHLNVLSKKLRAKRKANGALSLASMEIRFNIDSETRDPIAVEEKRHLETNSLVEEFMLLANMSVAERIRDDFPDCALLRRHPVPPPANYKPVVDAAETRGLQLCVDSGKALAESLDAAVLPHSPFFNTLLRVMTCRCMTQAVYFCSGGLSPEHYFHFGLAAPIYTHFTSPIRRYADLVVHRLLAVSVRAQPSTAALLDSKRTHNLCVNLNYRHKQAQYAGRASVLLNTHLFFKDKIEDLEGYILFVRKNAIQVLIPKYGLESAVVVSADSALSFNEEDGTMSCGQVTLRAFDRVLVQLSLNTTDQQHPRLQLKLVQPEVQGFSVQPLLIAPESASY